MFKWKVWVSSLDYPIEEGDWGRDIVTPHGIKKVTFIELFQGYSRISINPKNGVIQVDRQSISLGVNIGGYSYTLCYDCFFELIEMAPLTTASYSLDTKTCTNLNRHLFLKYKITHVISPVDRKTIKLAVPVFKEYLIKFDLETGLAIC